MTRSTLSGSAGRRARRREQVAQDEEPPGDGAAQMLDRLGHRPMVAASGDGSPPPGAQGRAGPAPKADSSRSTNAACEAFALRRASETGNHATWSISGNVRSRLLPGGHGISNVFEVAVAGSRSPSTAQQWTRLPLAWIDRAEVQRGRGRVARDEPQAGAPSPRRTRGRGRGRQLVVVVGLALRDRPVPEVAAREERAARMREEHLETAVAVAVEEDPGADPPAHRPLPSARSVAAVALADVNRTAFPRHDADRSVVFERRQLDLRDRFEAVLPERRLEVLVVEALALERRTAATPRPGRWSSAGRRAAGGKPRSAAGPRRRRG